MTFITPPVDYRKCDYTIDCSEQRCEFGIADANLCFGILGTLLRWKGQHVFIEAARRVFECVPNARAFIVGGVPDRGIPAYGKELREIAKSLGIADKAIFHWLEA